jgi:hypothetical protein
MPTIIEGTAGPGVKAMGMAKICILISVACATNSM